MPIDARLLRPHLDAFDTYTLLAMVNLHGKLPPLAVPPLLHSWNARLGPLLPAKSPATPLRAAHPFRLPAKERAELVDNSFVSPQVVEHIERLRFERSVQLPGFGRVRYVTAERTRDTSLIERTIAWCCAIMPRDDAPPAELTIFFTPLNKTAGPVLSPNEVNSGCTVFREDRRAIYIWREEDILRTVIHELIHAFDYDFRVQMNLRTTNIFNEVAGTNALNVNETFTEVVAVVLHCIAVAAAIGQPAAFETLLAYEYAHSLAICNKILDHFQLPGLSCIEQSDCRIDEKTNVVEYTLFKTLCLRDLNRMVREQFLREKLSFDVDEIYDFNEFLLNGLTDEFYAAIRRHRNDFSESLRFAMFALRAA